MNITSLPQDGDPLIEIKKGPLGQDVFVGTEILQNFFADLVSAGNMGSNITRIVNTTVNQVQLQNSAEFESLRRQIQAIHSQPQQSLAPILRQIDELAQNWSAQLAAVAALASLIDRRQTEIESKLNSVEHLCLSNLVRPQVF